MRLSTAALTIAAMMMPVLAATAAAPLPPTACISRKALYELLNAANRHDRLETAQLAGTECQPLAGARYELVGERNGVSEIRLFPRENDWPNSRLVYTFDEMLEGAGPQVASPGD